MVYKKIKLYFLSLISVLLLDFTWLFLIMKDFYSSQFINLARPEVLPYWSAACAWLVIPLGIVMFVDKVSKDYKESLIYGAIFGLILYGLYDFTNYATLKGWTLKLLIVDICWGIVICSLSSVFTKYVSLRWLK